MWFVKSLCLIPEANQGLLALTGIWTHALIFENELTNRLYRLNTFTLSQLPAQQL